MMQCVKFGSLARFLVICLMAQTQGTALAAPGSKVSGGLGGLLSRLLPKSCNSGKGRVEKQARQDGADAVEETRDSDSEDDSSEQTAGSSPGSSGEDASTGEIASGPGSPDANGDVADESSRNAPSSSALPRIASAPEADTDLAGAGTGPGAVGAAQTGTGTLESEGGEPRKSPLFLIQVAENVQSPDAIGSPLPARSSDGRPFDFPDPEAADRPFAQPPLPWQTREFWAQAAGLGAGLTTGAVLYPIAAASGPPGWIALAGLGAGSGLMGWLVQKNVEYAGHRGPLTHEQIDRAGREAALSIGTGALAGPFLGATKNFTFQRIVPGAGAGLRRGSEVLIDTAGALGSNEAAHDLDPFAR